MGKNNVMVSEKRKGEVIDFANQYRMRVENQRQYKVMMNGQIMEEVNEFKYLCKYGSMEGEIRERAFLTR